MVTWCFYVALFKNLKQIIQKFKSHNAANFSFNYILKRGLARIFIISSITVFSVFKFSVS